MFPLHPCADPYVTEDERRNWLYNATQAVLVGVLKPNSRKRLPGGDEQWNAFWWQVCDMQRVGLGGQWADKGGVRPPCPRQS